MLGMLELVNQKDVIEKQSEVKDFCKMKFPNCTQRSPTNRRLIPDFDYFKNGKLIQTHLKLFLLIRLCHFQP